MNGPTALDVRSIPTSWGADDPARRRPADARSALALAVAAAVDEVPAARRASAAGRGTAPVETLHGGGRVEGVRITPDRASLRLVVRALPLGPVVDAVRARVAEVLGAGDDRPIDVEVVDLDLELDRGTEPGIGLDGDRPAVRPCRAS